ncbi:Uncharacterised protein [Yersinia intermedia]|uniref:Uncharacterized protein n=1 Tax=Yersinia intermedia TaxID=631 RepID=A0A0H5MJG2_YERIN|nr:Uncharacterised protein [Yersinia intermedia]
MASLLRSVPPSKVAPPLTTKVTLTFGTVFPLPSFTVALTALVAILFAAAPLATVKSVLAIMALVSSASKVEVFAAVVLVPTVAVTA